MTAAIFAVNQQEVSRYCFQVREALNETFVKNHLGRWQSREQLISHNTELATELYLTKPGKLVHVHFLTRKPYSSTFNF
jgi:hypothetical protein